VHVSSSQLPKGLCTLNTEQSSQHRVWLLCPVSMTTQALYVLHSIVLNGLHCTPSYKHTRRQKYIPSYILSHTHNTEACTHTHRHTHMSLSLPLTDTHTSDICTHTLPLSLSLSLSHTHTLTHTHTHTHTKTHKTHTHTHPHTHTTYILDLFFRNVFSEEVT